MVLCPVPTLGALLNPQHVGEVQAAHVLAKSAAVTVPGIGEYHSLGRISLGQGAQLLQGDLRFGLECDLFRNSIPSPAFAILDPFLGHIKPIDHRKAGMEGGYGNGHRTLTVVLFPQLTTILPGHTHRMFALFRKSGVIDDPRQDRSMALHFGQDIIPYRPHHFVIIELNIPSYRMEQAKRAQA